MRESNLSKREMTDFINEKIDHRYHPVAVANYFLELAHQEKAKVKLLKLIKLVYMAHGWSLYFHSCPLVDESVEAWPYGPVLPSVYHTFKHWERKPIKKTGTYFDLDTGQLETPEIAKHDTVTRELIQKVWATYKYLSGFQLSDLTHMSNSAWDRRMKQTTTEEKVRNLHIDDDLVLQEFKDWFEKYETQSGREIKSFVDI